MQSVEIAHGQHRAAGMVGFVVGMADDAEHGQKTSKIASNGQRT
jgi:hypothetical protein